MITLSRDLRLNLILNETKTIRIILDHKNVEARVLAYTDNRPDLNLPELVFQYENIIGKCRPYSKSLINEKDIVFKVLKRRHLDANISKCEKLNAMYRHGYRKHSWVLIDPI